MQPLKQKLLPYPLDALEPVLSEKALSLHYNGHYAGYVKKFNQLIKADIPNLRDITFNCGGALLHELYFDNLSPVGRKHEAPLLEDLFGQDYREFLSRKLLKHALEVQGSGWSILIFEDDILDIQNLPNHELETLRGSPLLVLDMWEHNWAYQYLNKKTDFLNKFPEIINWTEVEERFQKEVLTGRGA